MKIQLFANCFQWIFLIKCHTNSHKSWWLPPGPSKTLSFVVVFVWREKMVQLACCCFSSHFCSPPLISNPAMSCLKTPHPHPTHKQLHGHMYTYDLTSEMRHWERDRGTVATCHIMHISVHAHTHTHTHTHTHIYLNKVHFALLLFWNVKRFPSQLKTGQKIKHSGFRYEPPQKCQCNFQTHEAFSCILFQKLNLTMLVQ